MKADWKMAHRASRVHFVGIGGSGMSGIAEVLLGLGYRVSGSDLATTPTTEGLASRGAWVHRGHDAEHVKDVDVVVVSSAIPGDNSEVTAARELRIPVVQRAEMLAELMRLEHGVIVAGSHGKTTTSAMVAAVLVGAGLDPTAVIGGRPVGWSSSARVGRGGLLVAEADESDGSFLQLTPTFSLITNVDPEHLDHYGGDVRALEDAFVSFAERVPFWGTVVLCLDDPGIRRILPRINRRVTLYGTSADADIRLVEARVDSNGTNLRIRSGGEQERSGHIRLFGHHNALNAVGAVTLARELGVDPETALAALAEFEGVDRRLTFRGAEAGIEVFDDYAHHPTEIRATLAAVRAAFPDRRIHVGFQPHRFSRTRDLVDDFAGCFRDADQVVVAPIYAAGEPPIPGVTSSWLVDRIEAPPGAIAVPDLDALEAVLAHASASPDLVLLLGAGDVHRRAAGVLSRLSRRPRSENGGGDGSI